MTADFSRCDFNSELVCVQGAKERPIGLHLHELESDIVLLTTNST